MPAQRAALDGSIATVSEVARLAGITPSGIRRSRDFERIAFRTSSGQRLYIVADVLDVLAARGTL